MAKPTPKKPAPKAPAPKRQAPPPARAEKSGVPAVSDTVTAAMLEKDSGAGNSGVTTQDLAIPFLYVLQAQSPQCMRQKPEYVADAKAGDIYNNVTKEVYDGADGVQVLNLFYHRRYTEWRLRTDGGGGGQGFVQDYGTDASILAKCTKAEGPNGSTYNKTPGGNQLVDAGTHYVMFKHPDTGAWGMAIIAMASTQHKPSRQWNTMINHLRVPRAKGDGDFQPARFYMMYKMTTEPQSNKKGDWFGWKIDQEYPILEEEGGDQVYIKAKSMSVSAAQGLITAAPPSNETAGDGSDGDGPVPF